VAYFLYGSVLAAGLYAALAGLGTGGPVRLAGFLAGLVVLIALEPLERHRYAGGVPLGAAVAMLAVRVVLFIAVSALDPSGTARSLFLLVPFTAYFTLGRRAGLALAACCLAALVVGLSTRPGWYTDRETVGDLLMFTVGLAFTVAMAAVAVREDAGRLRAEALLGRLEIAHRQLRAFADQASDLAATAERNRVARDIHDHVGHHLTVISVQLEKAAVFRTVDPAAADQAIDDARQSARLALTDVRRSVGALRTEQAPFALTDELTALADRLGDTGLAIDLDLAGQETSLGDAELRTLYEVALEALTNARRHADAHQVTLRLQLSAEGTDMTVSDDGRGFADHTPGFGLRGMRERLELVGGSLCVDSTPGRGTTVTATLPGMVT
jgi:signal transduction histidine kinase